MQPAPITPATITLDGKDYVLRFSNSALKAIKEQFHVSVLRQGPAELFKSVDEDQLSKLLVLGLNHRSEGGWPGVTEIQVDELLDAQNAAGICGQVFQALGASILKNALDVVHRWMAEFAAKAEADRLAAQMPKAPEPPPNPPIPDPTDQTVM